MTSLCNLVISRNFLILEFKDSYSHIEINTMPTPLDRALNSRNMFFGFAGIVTAAAAWSIWGGDMFPAIPEPKGDPENWTEEEMRRWLNVRNLMAGSTTTREELLARVKANMRAPKV